MKYYHAIMCIMISVMIIALLTSCDKRDNDNSDYEIVSLSISPSQLYADNNAATNSQIEVRVDDNAGIPAMNITVFFETDLGIIINSAVTDSSGIAHSIFRDNGQSGIAHIIASLSEDGSQAVTDSLTILPFLYNISSMTVNPHTLYADGNMMTHSEVSITVEDNNGFPTAGAPVIFAADLGYIQGKVYTDESGVAFTQFNENGIVGTAHISAWIEGYENIQVVRDSVEILPTPYLNIISITANPEVIFLDNGVTYSEIEVMVQDHNGMAAPDEDVYFRASIGNIISHVVTDVNGLAVSSFWDNGEAGIAEIDAFAGVTDTTICVTILDGNVTELNLQVSSSDPIINEVMEVSASAANDSGLVPDGKEITFSTELGFFQISESDPTPEGQSITASTLNGIATVYLNAGTQSGTSLVTAEVIADAAGNTLTDTEEITIHENDVSQLHFTSEPFTIMACDDNTFFHGLVLELLDSNGNLILSPREVWYKFLTHPEGSNIENIVYNLTDSTSVISNEGQAIVFLHSGTQTGAIAIQAWARNAEDQMISAVFEDISVVAGVPAQCQINISGMNSGIDMGGGMWALEISAYLTDAWSNPVADGTSAYFSIRPNLDYASIGDGGGPVGNENLAGETVAGTAFGTFAFFGEFTNEMVNFNVDTINDITFEQELALPLQFGEITMLCSPIHCDWVEAGDEEDKLTQCRITVQDGQQNPISNQRIMFSSTLGDPTDENIHPVLADIDDPVILELYDWEGINEDTDPYDGYTGWYEGHLGRLYKYVAFHKYECPQPIPEPPGMTTGVITATIYGTQISANQTISLFRYTD
ncbi:MAG: hypothetical protein K9M99_05155 [Candidatus Cloacimonetes bacterium]|nr:hypothetical protein [Candidatus Cloacimonadota bacterium]